MRKSNSGDVNKISSAKIQKMFLPEGIFSREFVLMPTMHFKELEYRPRTFNGVVVGVICNGTAKITIDDRYFELRRNSVFFLRDFSTITDFKCSKACKGYILYFSNSIFNATNITPADMLTISMMFGASPCVQMEESHITRLHSIASAISLAASEISNNYDMELRSSLFKAFFYALASVIGSYANEGLDDETNNLSRTGDLMRNFISLLSESCERERSVEYYASNLGITPKYLSLVCKKKTGYNASKLIDSAVIHRAKELLKQPGMSVLEVSERLNFVSQSFFGKYFKQRTGISPSRYKSQQ